MRADSPMLTALVRRLLLVGMVVFIGCFALFFALGHLAPDSALLAWGDEDGPMEYLGAVCWLAAMVLCAYRLFRGHEPRVLLFAWMLLTFACFGEEISWGQRILGFELPEEVRSMNEQGELNLHNIADEVVDVSFQTLFRVGFATYFLVIPVITLASVPIRKWSSRIGYVPPDMLFLLFVWAVIGASVVLQAFGPDEARRVTVETRESFYAVAVLGYVYLYLNTRAVRWARARIASHETRGPRLA